MTKGNGHMGMEDDHTHTLVDSNGDKLMDMTSEPTNADAGVANSSSDPFTGMSGGKRKKRRSSKKKKKSKSRKTKSKTRKTKMNKKKKKKGKSKRRH